MSLFVGFSSYEPQISLRFLCCQLVGNWPVSVCCPIASYIGTGTADGA
ncbi:hypothetical protein [Spirosoma flavum]|uniref:Uncharacterized protein n=1 Tax=Spirosoma flavum TaxID=2048557 RepID=A0ABW6AMN3_9BACT